MHSGGVCQIVGYPWKIFHGLFHWRVIWKRSQSYCYRFFKENLSIINCNACFFLLYVSSYQRILLLSNFFMALNSLQCTNVPLRNHSLTQSIIRNTVSKHWAWNTLPGVKSRTLLKTHHFNSSFQHYWLLECIYDQHAHCKFFHNDSHDDSDESSKTVHPQRQEQQATTAKRDIQSSYGGK